MKQWLCISLLMLVGDSIALANDQQNNHKIEITDSHGKWVFDAPPKRVAVINWTLTEQLLELGVTPVAIADIDGFQRAAPQTASLPTIQLETITNLGPRAAPNLTKLKHSKPELIIIGYSQRDLIRLLSHIAPVMYFNNFSRRANNASRADQHFLKLAKLFNKTEFAKTKLQQRNQKISLLKGQLQRHFKGQRPQLSIVTIEGNNAWLYSTNSMPYHAIKQLGFEPALSLKTSKLGTHKRKLSDLAELPGCLLQLNSEVANPTRHTCSSFLAPAYTYGGAMSLLYLANSISEALLSTQFMN